MSVSLHECSAMLATEGVRHHLDVEAGVIHVVLASRDYQSRRDERLIVIRLTAPDDGRRCRMAVHRAFMRDEGGDPSAASLSTLCLAACRLAADVPQIGVEYDESEADLRLVVETVVEDGVLTALQLLSMIDSIVLAAESWPAFLRRTTSLPPREAA